jgi:hypothetical protein
MKKCPICKCSSEISPYDYGGKLAIDCTCCGRFKITDTALRIIEVNQYAEEKKLALSHWIRSVKRGKDFIVNSDLIKELLETLRLPKVNEQVNNLILWLGDNLSFPEAKIKKDILQVATIIGARGSEGLRYIADHLKEEGLIEYHFGTQQEALITLGLTYKGWLKFSEINQNIEKSKIAFIAMKFGDPFLDKIFDVFHKALSETGFELIRLDKVLEAGLIDNQLRAKIRQAKFILADLTEGNSGAYWEAGYAEGLGKPVIYLCKKSYWEEFKTHFDTNHHVTIMWEEATIIEDMKKLKATVRATLPNDAKMDQGE